MTQDSSTRASHSDQPTIAERRESLDARSRAIYDAIVEQVNELGYPPSLREIGSRVGLSSPSSVKHQLTKLEDMGLLRRDPHRPRTIEVVMDESIQEESNAASSDDDSESGQAHVVVTGPWADRYEVDAPVAVPLVGRVAAGAPILAEQDVDDVMALPRRLTGDGELFMLEVNGDSMIEAAICDGDWVVVRRQNDANVGDIVAAMLDDVDGSSATIKVLSRKDGHQWLLPRNENYAPIPADHAQIMGKVVSVLRAIR
ncbi:transcriptional repressor LexA [Actinomyces vulturis]|uniref:transcriptional repressor LexA n=1 Tax=Actinomyces vulturis TaxID=1857645 RepID=UPI0009F607C7|nr:transcriptional repressor LexA [Actinomyces vulturis]